MKTKIAEFKARLSYYLKAVRSGKEVTVMERDTPIARVLPYPKIGAHRLHIRPASESPADLKRFAAPPAKDLDSLAALQEAREDDLDSL